jgi:REP element-mobilizing transposase RayT
MGGIIRSEKGSLLAIGGIEDHVHLYLRWRPDAAISDLMRALKSQSSKWLHEEFPTLATFAWQEGYGVFSVSKSQEVAVKNYIANQADHHRTTDFKTELLDFLQRHGIEYDGRYVFD